MTPSNAADAVFVERLTALAASYAPEDAAGHRCRCTGTEDCTEGSSRVSACRPNLLRRMLMGPEPDYYRIAGRKVEAHVAPRRDGETVLYREDLLMLTCLDHTQENCVAFLRLASRHLTEQGDEVYETLRTADRLDVEPAALAAEELTR